MKTSYTKQPIPVSEQIHLLEEKGMEFYDRQNASRILSIIGYYRFSGYAYPFRSDIDNSGFIELCKPYQNQIPRIPHKLAIRVCMVE